MTNHPIERETHPMVIAAAKALFYHDNPKDGPRSAAWESPAVQQSVGNLVPMAEWYQDMAIAALSALRDLTPDVVEAGNIAASMFSHQQVMDELDGKQPQDGAEQLPAAFTAMLNTIIGERG